MCLPLSNETGFKSLYLLSLQAVDPAIPRSLDYPAASRQQDLEFSASKGEAAAPPKPWKLFAFIGVFSPGALPQAEPHGPITHAQLVGDLSQAVTRSLEANYFV